MATGIIGDLTRRQFGNEKADVGIRVLCDLPLVRFICLCRDDASAHGKRAGNLEGFATTFQVALGQNVVAPRIILIFCAKIVRHAMS